MTGNELLQDLADIARELTLSGAEQTRALRYLNAEKRVLEGMLSSRPGRHLLRSATFSTAADRSPNRYSKPDDFGKLKYMERVVDESTGDYERLRPVQHVAEKGNVWLDVDDWHEHSQMITTDSRGRPSGYLIGDDFIQLFPISDAAYTIRVWYHKRYADITASDTELNIPEELAEPLLTGAKHRLYQYLHLDTGDLYQQLIIAREGALAAVTEQVIDGPKIMRLEIPTEDWA